MIIKMIIEVTATGRGSKSALAELKEDIMELESLIQQAAEEWAEQHEGDAEDPEIEWSVQAEAEIK